MNFWFKLFNFLLCVCVIVGYNFFVDINAKDNIIKELNTKVSSLEKQVEYDDNYIEDIKTKINKNNGKESKVEETTTSSKYKDGTYDGEAKGFGGNIRVSLTVKNDIITEINVVSADKYKQNLRDSLFTKWLLEYFKSGASKVQIIHQKYLWQQNNLKAVLPEQNTSIEIYR